VIADGESVVNVRCSGCM